VLCLGVEELHVLLVVLEGVWIGWLRLLGVEVLAPRVVLVGLL